LRASGGSPANSLDIELSTSTAESAEVTKKITSSRMLRPDSSADSGRASYMVNRTFSGPLASAPAMSTPPKICPHSAVPPKTENHAKPSRLGTTTTPSTNSRTVRPYDTRAMNAPTNGDQEIHHAQ